MSNDDHFDHFDHLVSSQGSSLPCRPFMKEDERQIQFSRASERGGREREEHVELENYQRSRFIMLMVGCAALGVRYERMLLADRDLNSTGIHSTNRSRQDGK